MERIIYRAGSKMEKIRNMAGRAREVLRCKRGDAFLELVAKILIAVVVGALLLTLIYALMKDTVMPTLTDRVKQMFDYTA